MKRLLVLCSLITLTVAIATVFQLWVLPAATPPVVSTSTTSTAPLLGKYHSSSGSAASSETPLISPGTAAPTSSGGVVYHNQRLRMNFNVPTGYRLATLYMRLLNDTSGYPIKGWSATNTQAIVLTQSTPAQEESFVSLSSQGGGYVDINPVAELPHSIYIAAGSITLADLKSVNAELPARSKFIFQEVSMPTTEGVTNGIRYSTPMSNGTSEEIVYISFPDNVLLSSGNPV